MPSTARLSRAGRFPGFTLRWFSVAWHDPQVRQAFLLSVKVGLAATLIAMVLGTAVA